MDEQAQGGQQGEKAMGMLMMKVFLVALIAAAVAHGVQYLLTEEPQASVSGGVAGGGVVATLMMMRRKG